MIYSEDDIKKAVNVTWRYLCSIGDLNDSRLDVSFKDFYESVKKFSVDYPDNTLLNKSQTRK